MNERAKGKKFSFGFLASNEEREKVRFGDLQPGGKYAFTNSTDEGIFKYSKSVIFNYVFVKPRSLQAKLTYVIGIYKGNQVFKRDIKFGGMSEWIRIFFDEEYVIDEIRIGKNTIIDNLETKFNYGSYEDNLSIEQKKDFFKNGTSSNQSIEDIIASALEKSKFKSGIYANHEGLRKMAKESVAVQELLKKFKQVDDFSDDMKKQDLELKVIDLKGFDKLLKKLNENYDPSKNAKQNIDQNMREVKKFLDERIQDMETLKVKTSEIIHNLKIKNLMKIQQSKKKLKDYESKAKQKDVRTIKRSKSFVNEKDNEKEIINFNTPIFNELTQDEINLLNNEVKPEDSKASLIEERKTKKRIKKEKGEEKKAKREIRMKKEKEDKKELDQMENDIRKQIKSGDSEIDKVISDLLDGDGDEEEEDY